MCCLQEAARTLGPKRFDFAEVSEVKKVETLGEEFMIQRVLEFMGVGD